ncbi:uncharacterized protein HMPREF1541_10114 [Cyphellophora europaea CBS 101466]|uniref:AB hydrolase-1 domain-containing protein n=1 Tax=Cyphellophora europaea (strain CBS 101466) TaxID=1220924 RepID=W2S988_CYPE1|nr:uncharacterized protein HMPREF1541_10114 [Cyphellophora europaea CBS 101466]ETN45237.1 hypothetical protein HMPREF1541_10114 [Cyphellophora europaea CBS 101466]
MSKPTIVTVHGAWHSPAHFEPLARILRQHGYTVVSVSLPSVVDRGTTPLEDPRDDIRAVRDVVVQILDAGDDVVLVPHSYGGIPASSAVRALDSRSRSAAGKSTSVIGVAAISAYVAREGDDIATAQDLPSGERAELYAIDGLNNYIQSELNPHKLFYADIPESEAEKWTAMLRPMLRTALWTNKSEYSAHKDIPIHYLVCNQDRALPKDTQWLFINKVRQDGGSVRVEEVEASHSPFLSMPDRTSDFIRRSAGENLPA